MLFSLNVDKNFWKHSYKDKFVSVICQNVNRTFLLLNNISRTILGYKMTLSIENTFKWSILEKQTWKWVEQSILKEDLVLSKLYKITNETFELNFHF